MNFFHHCKTMIVGKNTVMTAAKEIRIQLNTFYALVTETNFKWHIEGKSRTFVMPRIAPERA